MTMARARPDAEIHLAAGNRAGVGRGQGDVRPRLGVEDAAEHHAAVEQRDPARVIASRARSEAYGHVPARSDGTGLVADIAPVRARAAASVAGVQDVRERPAARPAEADGVHAGGGIAAVLEAVRQGDIRAVAPAP